ncbi:hypothetical protein BU23DRAFT_2255 [Bimuria novae-zelandiae CBS 107.79]|uniref:Protein kinase domain-containing protein n=1 Tax=Bimuria novae-zelandiae CBS 107.79 TaxID=1447943 RepID=A0A6A5VU40_9PLEO|nr:hypothetical protein BU23DRAFT_2255 [Bimuria novae-zelandiae CBS 107.79]
MPLPGKFRIVKYLQKTSTSTACLCLPRHLDSVLEDAGDDDPEPGHSAGDIYRDPSIDSSKVGYHAKALRAQLVVVKMYNPTTILRTERDALELFHDFEASGTFIGAWTTSEVLFTAPQNSYLCLEPIFGKTLNAFGQTCLVSPRIPTYFVWHIFLGLIDGLNFVHGAGLAHGNLNGDNMVMRRYAPRHGLRYYNYPDLVLTGFDAATTADEVKAKDVYDLVKIMYDSVVKQWSDTATLLDFIDLDDVQTNSLLLLVRALRDAILGFSNHAAVELQDLTNDWKNIAIVERAKGPEICPQWIKDTAYDELATDEQLKEAARPPLGLNFRTDQEEFRQWVRARRAPVALKKRWNKSSQAHLLVFKFQDKASRATLATLATLDEPLF